MRSAAPPQTQRASGSVAEYARWYVGLDIPVLPVHWPTESRSGCACSCGKSDCASPAKHPFGPLAKNGIRDATKDPAVIERWFRNPRLGIGIATGAVSGLLALDIDPRHDGDETLVALERQHGPIPHTWRFLTGGGGEHILLRHPGGTVPNSVGRLGPGIDVRGDGGYLVAPPSRHISGRPYAVSVDDHPDEVPLADAPGWLIPLLRGRVASEQARAKPASDWRDLVRKPVKEGQRNQTLAKLAGHLLRNRIDPWVALELLQAWNQARCEPPLDDAELLTTVRSIARREVERREGRDG